jgi:D-alanyl-D-alanine carboxypeptidase
MRKMKKRYYVLFSVLLVLIIGIVAMNILFGPLNRNEFHDAVLKELETVESKNDEITSVLMTIYSDKKNLSETFAVGTTGPDQSEPVSADQPYYTASIGKTFTSTLIGMLCDEGHISYEDPVSMYLDKEVLDGLFVFEGIDYQNQVTIVQLLQHMSGIGDYFEDPVSQGKTMLESVITEQDKMWTPLELLAFTRDNQKSVAKPGDTFHYSDTGYILLGLLIESVTGQEYHEVLQDRILTPLAMNDTYMQFKSEPAAAQTHPMLEVYVDGVDYSKARSLSMDWTGGGIVSTLSDLLTFIKALNEGQLVDADTLERMTTFDQKYRDGINYGLGMMEFDFGGFSVFLENMPSIYGGVGSTSTFMMYDKKNDTYIIANYGSLDFMEKSVPSLINIMMLLDRLEE